MPRTPRILIIDDDVDFVESLRAILESDSHEILTANSSDDGMRLVERSKPDLILLDVMMPEATEGFHFVWKLRNHNRAVLRKIPIIVISGIHHTTNLRFYQDQRDTDYQPREFLPVHSFLDKPFEMSVLLDHVHSVLSEARKHRE